MLQAYFAMTIYALNGIEAALNYINDLKLSK